MKKQTRIIVQIVIGLSVYFALSTIVSDSWLIVILITLALIMLFYGNKGKKSYTYYLDSFCDVEKHLIYIEAKLNGKNESLYILYKTYGELLNGKTEGLEEELEKIELSELSLKETLIYEEIKLKLLYYNKDMEGYNEKLNELIDSELYIEHQNLLLVFMAPLHLLKEEYEKLVSLMFEIIPKQKESYRVIELEYYLALAYIEQGNKDDLKAVLEFITKRNLKIDFVVKSKILLEQIE